MKDYIDAGIPYPNNEGYNKISEWLEDMIDEASEVSAAEITLAEGNILVGNASGAGSALNAKGDAKILLGNGTTLTSASQSGDGSFSNAGVFAIASDSIINTDIKSDAAIAFTKLAALADGNILVGNSSNVATSVNPSGDVDVSNAGVFSITSDSIINTDIKSDAAIVYSKLALTSSIAIGDLSTAVNVHTGTAVIAGDGSFPAPTGANQLNVDLNHGFRLPVNATIVGAAFVIDTAIGAGDATNHYEFNLYNGAAEMLAANTSCVAGLGQYTYLNLVCDQNATVSAGDVIRLRTDILDDAGAGPTDLSSTVTQLVVYYRLR
jgi:hypothetical protein